MEPEKRSFDARISVLQGVEILFWHIPGAPTPRIHGTAPARLRIRTRL
jgi:hypothetical protein